MNVFEILARLISARAMGQGSVGLGVELGGDIIDIPGTTSALALHSSTKEFFFHQYLEP